MGDGGAPDQRATAGPRVSVFCANAPATPYPSQAPLSLVLVQYELHNRFTFTLPTRVIHIPPRARAAPLVLAGGRCGGERRGRRCGVESRATAALRLVRPAPGV